MKHAAITMQLPAPTRARMAVWSGHRVSDLGTLNGYLHEAFLTGDKGEAPRGNEQSGFVRRF